MELSIKQKAIHERRTYIYSAYLNNEDGKKTGDKTQWMPVSVLVGNLARKFKITEVQVYNDIRSAKQSA